MTAASADYDLLIRNALVFDGSGTTPQVEDIAVKDGRIAARGANLPPVAAAEVVDADGRWLMPGLLDIHTHLDLEVEVNPGLGEAVRHGSTSVVVGNCSLGTAFGPQMQNGENPIIDCFTRVENMPKRVLQKCVEKMHWNNTADYLEHFKQIPLGPNIAPLVPHSMLRIEVMGVHGAVNRKPTEAELERMQTLLREALEQGYIGMSTDGIVFHYLSNDPHKEERIPTQFADETELKSLIALLREYERVWQATPDSQKMGTTLRRFFWTSGRLHGKPLRVSALTAIDFKSTPGIWKAFLRLAGLLNSWLLKGKFHFQALSTNFRMWGNGIQIPFFEELASTRALIACEADDREGRMRLMADPAWQQQFREDWARVQPKQGLLASLPSRNIATFQLVADEIFIDEHCPVSSWRGLSLSEVHQRYLRSRDSGELSADPLEADLFKRAPEDCERMDGFFLHCLQVLDMDFRWWMDVANVDRDITKKLIFNKNTLPGFNDSGAHITNLAFYDGNLLTLQLAQEDGLDKVALAVKRLTRDPAEFFGLDAGSIDVGDFADLVLVNPDSLQKYDTNAKRELIYNPFYEHDVLVNRSDGVVEQVYIRGTRVWEAGCRFTEALGTQTLGRALTCVR